MTRLEEPRCQQCGRAKVIVTYVDTLGQRAKLPLKPGPFGNGHTTDEFAEPYPEGHRASLLACTECDYTGSWQRKTSLQKKKRLR